MTTAPTLTRYISWRFTLMIVSVFLLCLVLIFFVDFIEMLRRAGKFGSVPATTLIWLTLLRLPSVSEAVLPFAVLIGSIGAFLMLSRSSELVVARSAGMSAWQFILPALGVAFLLGVLAVTAYNPVSASAKAAADRLYVKAFGREGSVSLLKTKGAGSWLRQEGVDGQSVIHAKISTDNGLSLNGVTVFQYGPQDTLVERIEARAAKLKEGRWELQDAWVSAVGRLPSFHESYILSTYLTPTQVRTALGSVSSISFWELPEFIAIAEKAGLSAEKYKLRYQMLLSRPLLLAVMVLLAATCSLRAFRFGKIQTLVIAGLAGGFAFFIFVEVSRNLGRYGVAAPEVAAWAPVCISGLLALTLLLYQEDG